MEEKVGTSQQSLNAAADKVLKVLVVDDDPMDRQILRLTFAQTDLNVALEEVDTAEKAIALLKSRKFDAAILDYKLPDGTAISVLKSLQDEYFRTPVIIMTVHAQKSVALEALHLGAQDFLHKDKITPDSLERALRYAIERHRLMHELQCSKERERREQELRSYMENISDFETTPPSVKESEQTFEQLIVEYKDYLSKSVEESAFKVPQEIPDRMRELATKLGEMRAGPKDVVDIHAKALKQITKTASVQKEEAITAEGRIMLVQLLGHLCGFYRNKILAATGESRQREKKKA